jgi:glycine cleavage system regulatory protein
MMTPLVLAFICHDKPGLVNILSEKIAAAEGSWMESRLAHLAGEFAGIVLVSVPESNVAGLTAALRSLEEADLRITIQCSSGASPVPSYRALELELVSHDRPGIVRDVTATLSLLGANIEEFSSAIESAPFTGERMFRATARLHVPDDVTREEVRTTLERLAGEMMVDLTTNADGGL